MSELLCLEDFTEGQVIELGTTSVSAEEIVQFGRAYDPQAFHVDPEAAARSPFGGLIASGWHTAALFMRLYTDQILLRSACLDSPGVSDLRWRSPVRPGQVLRARVTIERVEPSAKRDDRGTVWPVCEFRDEGSETIFSMILLTLLRRRSAVPRSDRGQANRIMNSLLDRDEVSAQARNGVRPVGYDIWHPGEIALQRTAGAADALSNHARRILLPYLTDQLRAFFPLLPFIVVSFVDAKGNPWGTILPGVPGFMSSPASDLLRIDRVPPAGDPFAAALREGAPIGLLGIELPTRRRNRVNGVVSACDVSGFTVTVQQAYGNCPRYIQQRGYADAGELPGNVEGEAFADLEDTEARALLSRADTMFVASYALGLDGAPAMDVSHRGGKPGFLRLDDDSGITIPDFAGNRYFNTLGNILCTGRAGLIVPNFDTGDILLLTGDAAVGVDEENYAEAANAGAERLWRMNPRQGRWLRGALPGAFQLRSWSHHTLATGDWLQS